MMNYTEITHERDVQKKTPDYDTCARNVTKNTRQVPFSLRQKTAAGATHNYFSEIIMASHRTHYRRVFSTNQPYWSSAL